MDARPQGFGMIVPTPYYSSFLGKLVYIDQSGTAVAFANMFEAQVPSHLKALKPIGASLEISEQRGKGTTLLTTAGIAGRPLDKSELQRYLLRSQFGPKFPRGVLLADSIPPRPLLNLQPQFGLRFQPDSGRMSGEAFVLGPQVTERSLLLPESLVHTWYMVNRHSLENARSPQMTKRFPFILIVLKEWVAETWTHLAWEHLPPGATSTTIGLFQESERATPQWAYLQLSDETLTATRMGGNFSVYFSQGSF